MARILGYGVWLFSVSAFTLNGEMVMEGGEIEALSVFDNKINNFKNLRY